MRPKVPTIKVGNGFEIRYKQVPYDNRYFFLFSNGLCNGGPAGEQFRVSRNFVDHFGLSNVFHCVLDPTIPGLAGRLEAFENKCDALDEWLDNNPE